MRSSSSSLTATATAAVASSVALLALATISVPSTAHAQILGFEGFASPGEVSNVGPLTPYTEAGFTLTPINEESAVFDAVAEADFIGRSDSDFFGFSPTNAITLTVNGGGSFDLGSVILGPLDFSQTQPISVTLVGNLSGGGTLTQTFAGLSTATTETLNWTDLSSVVFTSNGDTGIDDILIGTAQGEPSSAAPEPATLALLAIGLLPVAGALIRRRRRRKV